MAADEPPYLSVGTDVSAKYKGAFCEAKIKKVNRTVKCKVTFKNGQGAGVVTDDQIRGTLRVGAHVEAKHPEKNQYMDAIINKVQDYSQYTVVFDDGDETTLRRTSLCLKSGRHFAESPTLDQFPLTNPEHFGTPVIGSKAKRKRRSTMNSASVDDDSSDEESTPKKVKESRGRERDPDLGKVVCVDFGDKRKKESWYPGLVVSVSAQDTVKINSKEDYLVRSFKDGKYYQVMKKETRDFTKEIGSKADNNTLRTAVEKALAYLDRDELPPHWDRALLMGLDQPSADEESHDSDSDTSDDEPSEEKDRFVAQLYKFMDERGTPINKAPTVGSRDLNLYKLFKIVHKMGGYNRVTNQNQWRNVYIKMGLPTSNPASQSHQMKQAYKRYLHSFEDFYRKLGCTMVTNIRSTRVRHRSDRNFIITRNRDRDISASRGRQQSKESKDRKKEEKLKSDEENKEEKQKVEIEKTEEKQADEGKKASEKQSDEGKKELDRPKIEGRKSLEKFKSEDVKKTIEKQRDETKKTVDKQKDEGKKGVDKQKDDGKRSLERPKTEDGKKNPERQKNEESKKVTDKQKSEEGRKVEKRSDDCRRSLDRLKGEDGKKSDKLKTESKKVSDKQRNDDRKKSPEKLKQDGKKSPEKLKSDDVKKVDVQKNEDGKKVVEKPKLENGKKIPEKQQKNDNRKKSPEKLKNEEVKKPSEKKIDERKKIDKQKAEETKRVVEKQRDESITRKIIDKQKTEDLKKAEKQKSEDLKISEKQKIPEGKKSDKQKSDKEDEKGKTIRLRTSPEKVEKEVVKEEEKNKVEKVEKARTREDARREKVESPEKKETRSSVKIDQERERREKEELEKKLMKDKEKRDKLVTKEVEKKEQKILKKEEKFFKEKKEEKGSKDADRSENKVVQPKIKSEPQDENLQRRKNGKKKLEKTEEKEEKKSKDSDDEDETSSREKDEKREDDIEVGDRVKVKYRYGRGRQHKIYEAKVLKIDKENGEKRFFVHYTGWNMRYDEWVKRNSIVENMSIKNRTTRRKKQVFAAKGVFARISGKRGRPPAIFAGKLTRKNSASSTSSIVSSRTTRSDRNSLTESPFAAGLEPRRRMRKKSGVSIADTSQDSESDIEPETPELDAETRVKVEKDIQEVKTEELSEKEDEAKDTDSKNDELNSSYETELPELKREDEWKETGVVIKKEDLSELDSSVEENVSEDKPKKDDNSKQDFGENDDTAKELPKLPKRRGRLRKNREPQTPPKIENDAEEESDEKTSDFDGNVIEERKETLQIDAKEHVSNHFESKSLEGNKESEAAGVEDAKRTITVNNIETLIKVEPASSNSATTTSIALAAAFPTAVAPVVASAVNRDAAAVPSNSVPLPAAVASVVDDQISPSSLPPSPVPHPLPVISADVAPSPRNIPLGDSSTSNNTIKTSDSITKDAYVLPVVLPPPAGSTSISSVDISISSAVEEKAIVSSLISELSVVITPADCTACNEAVSAAGLGSATSSSSDTSEGESPDIVKELPQLKSVCVQEDMTEIKDDILEQVEKNIAQIENLEKCATKRDAESGDDFQPTQKLKKLKVEVVEDNLDANKAHSPFSDAVQTDVSEDNSMFSENGKEELVPPPSLFNEKMMSVDDIKVEPDLKEGTEVKVEKALDVNKINESILNRDVDEESKVVDKDLSNTPSESKECHVNDYDDTNIKSDVSLENALSGIENNEKEDRITEIITPDISDEVSESKLDSSVIKKESKKKKTKGIKQDKKQGSLDSADKDDSKSKEGKKSKKKSKGEGDENDKTKDSESRPKSKKIKDKKNKNKKRSEKPESDIDLDSSKRLENRDEDGVVEKKKKEKKKKDDKKSNKTGYRSDENNEITKSEAKKKKGKKNKDKISGDKRSDGSSDKKSKKKKKGHTEIDTADSDSEKETSAKQIVDSEKSGKSSKKKKDKKKAKLKDSSSSDDASEARLSKDIPSKKNSKSADISESPVENLKQYSGLETVKSEDDPDMSFLLCEEKVPASPVGVDALPEESSGSSSIEGNSSPGQSTSETVERIDSISGEPYSGPESIQPADGISKHDPEACAVLDNTPPTTPESAESVLSSSPSHERESFSLPDAESTQSGRESGEGESDSFHGESREQDAFEREQYNAATTLFSVRTSIPEKIKEPSSRSERSLKRQKSETEDVSPSKKKKTSKRLHNVTDTTKSGHTKHKGSISRGCKDGKDNFEISGANTAVFSSPPQSSTSSHQVSNLPPMASHHVPLSADGTTHLLPRPSKFNFYVPLDDYKDADKRISILQEKLSELRKAYMALKAEVALIDRRRKKAKKKEKEPVSSASGSTSTLQSDEVQCSS